MSANIYIKTDQGPSGPHGLEQINQWVDKEELPLTAPASLGPSGPWRPLFELYDGGATRGVNRKNLIGLVIAFGICVGCVLLILALMERLGW